MIVEKRVCLSILVIEDNPLQRMLVSVLLRQLGHRVNVTGDGFNAISVCLTNEYDAVIIDYDSDSVNGPETSRLIRKIYSGKGIPVTIIGIISEADADRLIDNEVDNFLCKPLRKPILKALLGPCVRRKSEVDIQTRS